MSAKSVHAYGAGYSPFERACRVMSSDQTEVFRAFIMSKLGRDFRIDATGRHVHENLNGDGDDLAVVTPGEITLLAFEFGLLRMRQEIARHDAEGDLFGQAA